MTSTAYGFAYSAQNLMLFFGPAITGMIIDKTGEISGGYLWSSIFLFGLSIVTAIIGLIVLVWDYNTQAVLYRGIDRNPLPIKQERTIDTSID